MIKKILAISFTIFCFSALTQTNSLETKNLEQLKNILSKFKIEAYGVLNYYAFDWETLPNKRNAFDPENITFELYYNFTNKIELKTEIEFEHGGVGATMNFDPLEEFGEFEQEIEKGGEIVVEQLKLRFKIHKMFNISIGKINLHIGNASKQEGPCNYFTTYRSEVERTILPLGWQEIGVELSGDFSLKKEKQYPYLSYKAYIVSGLDNSGFSSQNWIKRGHQTRFETVNASELAYIFRLDYIFLKNSEIGFNVYAGNATGNRQKNDFSAPSWVTFGDIHFSLEKKLFRMRVYGMMGRVQNSEILSKANRNLSNNLNVKRTPVGEVAGGAYVEAAYDILNTILKNKKKKFYLFGRAEYYDSMLETRGEIYDNPRYERRVWTVGINYFPNPKIVIKSHHSWRLLGSGEKENIFALGFGFNF